MAQQKSGPELGNPTKKEKIMKNEHLEMLLDGLSLTCRHLASLLRNWSAKLTDLDRRLQVYSMRRLSRRTRQSA